MLRDCTTRRLIWNQNGPICWEFIMPKYRSAHVKFWKMSKFCTKASILSYQEITPISNASYINSLVAGRLVFRIVWLLWYLIGIAAVLLLMHLPNFNLCINHIETECGGHKGDILSQILSNSSNKFRWSQQHNCRQHHTISVSVPVDHISNLDSLKSSAEFGLFWQESNDSICIREPAIQAFCSSWQLLYMSERFGKTNKVLCVYIMGCVIIAAIISIGEGAGAI